MTWVLSESGKKRPFGHISCFLLDRGRMREQQDYSECLAALPDANGVLPALYDSVGPEGPVGLLPRHCHSLALFGPIHPTDGFARCI